MKYLIFLTTISLIFLASCKEKEDCKCNETKPLHNPFPIDWENYNDPYTIHWNFRTNDCSTAEYTGKPIKIEGWILQPGGVLQEIDPNHFYIVNAPNMIWSTCPAITIDAATPEVAELLKVKFKNSDLSLKCYITGKLIIQVVIEKACCYTFPVIEITNTDNIIFETEGDLS